MKNLTILFVVILLSSCYTKKQAIDKFCHQDTAEIVVRIHDTTIVESIITDTVFSASIDSFVVTKDKLVIKYLKIRDSIYLSGEYKGDTIYKIREIAVKAPCNCPPEYVPGFWDKVKTWLAVFGILSLIVFVIVLGSWKR
jgi:hypothetical protein